MAYVPRPTPRIIGDRPALPSALTAELEDFFVDLVGAFDDARARSHAELRSAVGSRFEAKARAFAERLEGLGEGSDLLDNPG